MTTKTSNSSLSKAWQWLVADKNGHQVLMQRPNLPIIGWFVTMVLTHIWTHGKPHSGLQALSLAFLFTWSYLEITAGASKFRRALGVIVGLSVVWSFFS